MPTGKVEKLAGVGFGLTVGVAAVVQDGPAGQAARRLIDVVVGVAGRPTVRPNRHIRRIQRWVIHCGAHGMQLEQLTGIVLVEAAGSADMVVEVIEHGRRLGVVLNHGAKVTERVRTYDVTIIVHEYRAHDVARAEHAEVIVPELNHALEQLAPAAHRARDARRLDLAQRCLPDHTRSNHVIFPLLPECFFERLVVTRNHARLTRAIVDGSRVELLIDELFDPLRKGGSQRREFSAQLGRRTIGQAVEHPDVGRNRGCRSRLEAIGKNTVFVGRAARIGSFRHCLHGLLRSTDRNRPVRQLSNIPSG